MKKHLNLKSPEFLISALGLLGLGGLYVYWLSSAAGGLPGKLAALLSAGLLRWSALALFPAGWIFGVETLLRLLLRPGKSPAPG